MGRFLQRFEAVAQGMGVPGRELASAARTVAGLVQGEEVTVDDRIYRTRIDICMHCRSLGDFRGSLQCRKCGCLIRKKARLKEFHCELGKW